MRITSEHVVYEMSPVNEAVASCEPGSKVTFVTKDCFSNQIRTEDKLFEATNWETINPATGPLAVKGASLGDTLKVEIEKIEIDDQGVMVTVPEMGALDKFIEESETKIIPIEEGFAVFNEQIKLPVEPMVGVIGTAPAEKTIPCGTPDSHGGNMDTSIIVAGSTLYLPVRVEGGLLAMGDLHAVMGDGEVAICGVEIAGEVTVNVDIIKGTSIQEPIVETENAFYTISSAPTLDKAAQQATDSMFVFLKERIPLNNNQLAMLISLICDLQISQIVDPKKTARMRVDKKALAEYKLKF